MYLTLGISKVKKYAVSESGDTIEFIERPGGGLSVVVVDGQRSGKSAKRISTKVAGKVVSLIAEGIRDGAAARAVSDFLYHERSGKVTATLNIISADLVTKTLVVTRNNPAPVYAFVKGGIEILAEDAKSIGTRTNTRPVIHEFVLEEGLCILAFTDGISNAGTRVGKRFDPQILFSKLLEEGRTAQEISDGMLEAAMELDQGRPVDDISVAVLKINPKNGDEVRRVSVQLPLSMI